MEGTSGLITSRGEFQAAVRAVFAEAADKGCREILCVDVDFACWPLDETAVLDALGRWALPHRRLTLVAEHFDRMPHDHPRWVAWRRLHSHVVDCRVFDEQDSGRFAALLLASPVVGLRLFDTVHWRGSIARDAADLLRWADQFDALLQRSMPSFPVTTLGL